MTSEITYQWLAIALLGSAAAISIYFRSRANRLGERISSRDEGPLIRVLLRFTGLLLWGSALAYLLNPAWMRWAQLPLPEWARWAGAALMLACVPLIYWLFSSLGMNVTPTIVTRRAHALVTHGPYRWIRHPLYTVGLLAFIGFSLLSAMWVTPLLLMVGAPVLIRRTRIEEQQLIQRFGDEYLRYMQTTGRFFPRRLG